MFVTMSRAAFPGLQSPAAGFDQPFEMLGACHDRVRRSLALLQRLVDHVAQRGADAQAASAARDVLRYFDTAAPAHHEDEERHVIPRLRSSGDARQLEVAQRLLEDHRQIHARWQALQPLLQALAQQASPPPLERLRQAADAFVEVHRDHLVLEDEFAFPSAERALRRLGEPALQAMGQEMARRRGVRG
jgi:hemerythrin-like domain-containing protein